MRINTFIVILLLTSIICNINNHIKGQEKNSIDAEVPGKCKATYTPFVEAYKEITLMTKPTDKGFVNIRKIVNIDSTNTPKVSYAYYTYATPAADGKTGLYTFTGTQNVVFTMTNDAPTDVKNFEFPWNTPTSDYKVKFGENEAGALVVGCTNAEGEKITKVSAAPDSALLTKYENIDPFMESYPEPRNAIDDAAIGEGVMLSRVDAAAPLKNYNIFLSKTQFCHFSCKIDNTECDLLVYETAKYDSKVVNKASIIGYTGKPKYYTAVKADAVAAVDTCAGAGSATDECTNPQYTIISKGAGKILTGYYKDDLKKYSVSTSSSPKMPAGIQAKFPTHKFCFKEPEVQGVSNMFINSILLILILILMI